MTHTIIFSAQGHRLRHLGTLNFATTLTLSLGQEQHININNGANYYYYGCVGVVEEL